MRFSRIAVAGGLAASATASSNNTDDVIQTVTAFVTYCPEPTTFVEFGKIYNINSNNVWVTVDCPGSCAITNKAGAQPTVVPAGVFPKPIINGTAPFTNVTIPVPGTNSGSGSGAGSGAGSPGAGSGASTGGSNGASGVGAGNGAASGPDNGSSSSGGSSGSSGSGSGSGSSVVPFTGAATQAVASSTALAVFFGAMVLVL